MGEEVPLRWFNFEKVVKGLVARKRYYLKLEQLQTIARKVCFIEDENEFGTMLDFYHDLGMIIRHRSTVVLRADWLIDVFRQLITIRPFNEMEPIHSKLWREMEITGILRMELVDYVFSKFCQQDVIKEDILNLMEQFGLIAKFATSSTDVKYFVPAQLDSPPGRLREKEPRSSDPCPLYLTFPAGFVPHGLFAQLVSRCIRWCSEIEFKMSPNLFNGASRFRLISKHFIHQLILVCKKRFIKIVLLGESALDHKAPLAEIEEMASLVWRFLKDTMKTMVCEFSYLTELQYDWCVGCPDCPGEEDICLLNILEGGQLSHCPNSFDNKLPTVPGLKIWFPIEAVRPGHHPGTEVVYNMTARPRGITLIININLFDGHSEYDKQSTRHGAEEDVRKVEALFGSLGFKVRTKENLTKQQIMDELDYVAFQDHSDYDCFVLWLMSHGESGVVFCSDGVPLPIQAARDQLCNANCVTLRGKPKLLFVQACRGRKEDEGVPVMTNICSLSHAQQSSHVDSPTDPNKCPAWKVPEQADFLTAYSTVDEYVSYRYPELGSTFVRALVKVFQERVAYDHLLEILTKVNQRVSEMENVEPKLQNSEYVIKSFKQVSQIESTLLKCLWF